MAKQSLSKDEQKGKHFLGLLSCHKFSFIPFTEERGKLPSPHIQNITPWWEALVREFHHWQLSHHPAMHHPIKYQDLQLPQTGNEQTPSVKDQA